jgi:hypothetical protein
MIEETGSDIASVLHYHHTSNREKFDEFEEAANRVLPEIDISETPIHGRLPEPSKWYPEACDQSS